MVSNTGGDRMESQDSDSISDLLARHGMVVTAEDVRQYVYCPRILFFRHVRQVHPAVSFKVQRGVDFHEDNVRKKATATEADGTVTRYYNVRVVDPDLGLLGVVDYFEVAGGLTYPVELKTGQVDRGSLPPHHKAQLAVQALLLEKITGEPVIKAKAVYADTKEEVEYNISVDDKAKVLRYLEEIRHMIAEETFPPPTKFAGRCRDCEYWNYCFRA